MISITLHLFVSGSIENTIILTMNPKHRRTKCLENEILFVASQVLSTLGISAIGNQLTPLQQDQCKALMKTGKTAIHYDLQQCSLPLLETKVSKKLLLIVVKPAYIRVKSWLRSSFATDFSRARFSPQGLDQDSYSSYCP